jgi:hypothetical protein
LLAHKTIGTDTNNGKIEDLESGELRPGELRELEESAFFKKLKIDYR